MVLVKIYITKTFETPLKGIACTLDKNYKRDTLSDLEMEVEINPVRTSDVMPRKSFEPSLPFCNHNTLGHCNT